MSIRSFDHHSHPMSIQSIRITTCPLLILDRCTNCKTPQSKSNKIVPTQYENSGLYAYVCEDCEITAVSQLKEFVIQMNKDCIRCKTGYSN